MVSSFLQEKKLKINSDLRFLMVWENDVALNTKTGVFLTLSEERLKSIPLQYLTYHRILSLAHVSENDVFYKIGMNDWSLISKFKVLI
jgi:hypothetical protein